MKKVPIVLGCLAILSLGVLLGIKIENKLMQKSENKRLQQLSHRLDAPEDAPNSAQENVGKSSSSKDDDSAKAMHIAFLVNSNSLPGALDDRTKKKIERLFSSKLIDFYFKYKPSNDGTQTSNEDIMIKDKVMFDAGSMDAFKIVEHNMTGSKLEALFTVSETESAVCSSEVQLVSNGSIKKVDDSNQKIIGVEKRAIPLSYLTIKKLKNRGLNAKELHIYRSLQSGVDDLIARKIDVFITRVSALRDNEFLSEIGHERNGSFPTHPELNIIYTSDEKIPCNIIFVSKNLPLKIQHELYLNLKSAYSLSENVELIAKGTRMISIRPILYDTWKSIEAKIEGALNFQLKYFSPLIYNHM